jgi:hypothetical protein
MAVPGSMTWIRGVRDTADEISQGKPLEISTDIWMHNPNKHKALSWFMSQSPVDPSTRRTFGHLEDAPNSNWIEYNGADETSQGVTGLVFTAGAGIKCGNGTRVINERDGQILLFTADFASTTTSAGVTRNWGRGASTDYLKKGDKLHILPPSFPEGFTTGDGVHNALYYKSFEMGEVSYPVKVTYTEEAEKAYAGKPFERALGKTMDQVQDQMEAEIFLSGSVLDTTTFAHPAGSPEGLENYITTHVYSATKISRMDFFDILTEWQINNKEGGAIFCSLFFKNMVTKWAMDSANYIIPITGQEGPGVYGATIDRVKWTVGTFDLIDVDILNQGEYLAGKVFFCPPRRWSYRPLINADENRDIRYVPINRDEVHSKEGEIYGVYGYHPKEEEMWARIDGLYLV